MKKNKGIKFTLIILSIILLSIISFVGIYVQNKNTFENVLPNYLLAKDLKGYRRVELQVSKESQTIKYDAEGKEIGENDTEKEVARTEEKKVNNDEVLTLDNYKNVKNIIENRLNKMNVSNYIIRQDNTNGNIILELEENSDTDRVIGQLYMQGKFEIVDKDTNEVLMTNQDLESVKAGYGTNGNGTTVVFINIQFNKEAVEKFKNITNTYIETNVEKEVAEGEEPKQETKAKEITIKIDDSTLLSTHFDEEVSNGLLQLSVGSSSSSRTDELQDYLLEANSMAALLNAGKMPIVYEVEQNKYVFSNITINEIGIAIIILVIILIIGIIYLIMKYKIKGILGSISLIGYIAILLIALRYFNVEISIGGLLGITLSIILNYVILANILKEKDVIKTIKKYALVLIPTLIIAIVFTFMNIGIGITLFWGIAISLLYNLSITNIMLRD